MKKNKKEKKNIISWSALEYEFKEKSANWFWAVSIISTALFIAAIFFKNFLFAIIIVIGAFTIMLYGARRPRKITVLINERGIILGDRFYEFDELSSFWIDEEGEKKELLLKQDKALIPIINIELNEDAEKVRKFLSQYLKEEKIEETFTTTLSRMIGF